ncbi:hypothetical protein FML28_01835 [Klebsiella grimontii]|nr:hypothetical protein [Klebsiella grimontii]
MALRLPGLRVSSRLRRRRPGKTFTPRPGISGSAPEGGSSGSPDRRDAPPPGSVSSPGNILHRFPRWRFAYRGYGFPAVCEGVARVRRLRRDPGFAGSAPEGGRSGSPDRRDAPPPGDFHAAADMSLKQRDMQRCPGPR